MSVSQYKSFCECESKALAELTGQYERPSNDAMLFGSYVDAYFSNELEQCKQHNPEVFKKSGELKSEFEKANIVIDRIERDPMFMQFMSGEKQVIKTGEIDGVEWKIKIDSYHPERAIVDLKIMRDMEPIWKDGEKQHFIKAWGYEKQAAVYAAIEGNSLPFYLSVATKETEPDLKIIQIAQSVMDEALEEIKARQGRFVAIKKGEETAEECGCCDWCKRNRILKEIELYEG